MSAESQPEPAEFNFELSQIEVVRALEAGVEQIREMSRRQVDTWKRIPYFALLSEGRSGYSGGIQRAYAYGLWTLSAPGSGDYRVADVDLASGEIVRPGRPELPASERQILSITPDYIDRLNASKILDRLVDQCRKPVSPHAAGTPESVAAWHREMMEKYSVTEYYVRPAAANGEEIRRQEDAALADDLAPSA